MRISALMRTEAVILAAALVLRLFVFWMAPGPLFPDEDFQYLEQAHRLAFGTGLVPWEYVVGIRSWLLPGLLAPIFSAARLLGDDPRLALWGVALLLSVVSLPGVACAMGWGRRAAGVSGAIAAGVLTATWFELAFFAPHALADSISASLLLPGLFLSGVSREPPGARTAFVGGLLLGLTVAVRLQLAPVVGLAWVLAMWRGDGRAVTIGIFVPVVLAGLLDALTLATPFQSFWLYAWVNLAMGGAASFGTSPWYQYAMLKFIFWSVVAVPLVVGMLAGAARRPMLLVYALAVILPFMALGHKEDRFILPALPLLLTLAGIGSAMLAARMFGTHAEWRRGVACGAFWCACSAFAVTHAPLWHFFYEKPGMNAAERIVNADPAACGVAIYPEAPWARMPGYTRYRPGIALYGFSPGEQTSRAAAFNYIIDEGTERTGTFGPIGFFLVQCWDSAVAPDWPAEWRRHLCLWHRPAPCDSAAAPMLAPPMPDFMNGAG